MVPRGRHPTGWSSFTPAGEHLLALRLGRVVRAGHQATAQGPGGPDPLRRRWCATKAEGGIDVEDRPNACWLRQRWRLALRSRPAGGGFKPPQAASVKSRGGERCGQGARIVRQVRAKKANVSEPLMTCRKRSNGIETEESRYLGKQPGGDLLIAQVVPGMEVARAWLRLWCKTWEPVASNVAAEVGHGPVRLSKGDPQVAETTRGRVPRRGTGTDRRVVATKPGNAGGAKAAGCSGSFGGQPLRGGRSR